MVRTPAEVDEEIRYRIKRIARYGRHHQLDMRAHTDRTAVHLLLWTLGHDDDGIPDLIRSLVETAIADGEELRAHTRS